MGKVRAYGKYVAVKVITEEGVENAATIVDTPKNAESGGINVGDIVYYLPSAKLVEVGNGMTLLKKDDICAHEAVVVK